MYPVSLFENAVTVGFEVLLGVPLPPALQSRCLEHALAPNTRQRASMPGRTPVRCRCRRVAQANRRAAPRSAAEGHSVPHVCDRERASWQRPPGQPNQDSQADQRGQREVNLRRMSDGSKQRHAPGHAGRQAERLPAEQHPTASYAPTARLAHTAGDRCEVSPVG